MLQHVVCATAIPQKIIREFGGLAALIDQLECPNENVQVGLTNLFHHVDQQASGTVHVPCC